MSCSVAIASSPVFSPSRHPLSCKTSPENLALLLQSDSSPSSTSCSSCPFKSRFGRGLKTSPESSSFFSNPSVSGSVLKRKRPARIDIPMMESLNFENRDQGVKEVEMDEERCSVYSKRGRKRVQMEDRFKVDVDLNGDPQLAFFGVFDGHSGAKAAEFAAEKIGQHMLDEVRREGGSNVEDSVRNAYLKTDSEYLKGGAGGGSCCVTAFVRNGSLVVSNAGDCRAVLSNAGTAEALTSDHRPSREDEKQRIERLGGYVDYCRGVWRLQGCLAVSRGIGDSHLKKWVIPDPETRILEIKPEYEFLILASDGLWDKVSNQEAVDIARPLCVDTVKPLPLSACKKLVDLSANRGSSDDISVMIIQLRHFV